MPIRKTALFCPMLMACDVLEPRWTMVILTEMWCGSTRFNDIRRGVPGISPTLLSKRLKQLEARGLVERVEDRASGAVEYLRTDAARELEPILDALGKWAYRHTDAEDQLCWLEPKFFMWNVRRAIETDALPQRRIVLKFSYPAQACEPRDFWVVARPGTPTDVCFIDPGFDVDLFIFAELRSLVAVYFGRARLGDELRAGRIQLIGSPVLERSIGEWFVLSSYAKLHDEPLGSDGLPPACD
ncbi:winged helix-turn-helix transcriptional regulator [Halomonas jincaotanensis]|uniref:winged helix-turn-helix transcriptional regulator n=1 Tax=Halomonas jincaotanensis TaxID=2810616 RepID=UPI002022F5C4|nr:helix-turn-helix domain-containing protein [Halomonas jincaotanensis]